MTDKTVALEAADVLDLGGNWIPQSSSVSTSQSNIKMVKANGDYQKFSSTYDVITEVTIPYTYSAITGMGAALPSIGAVENAYLITEISVDTSWDAYPIANFTAHNHGANAHADDRNEYAPSAAIQSAITGAQGAYDFAGLASGNICVQSSNYTLSLDHVDANCSTGDHWVGQNVKGMETISCTYIGTLATFTIADWTVTGYNIDDSNEAFDVSTITAEKLVLRT